MKIRGCVVSLLLAASAMAQLDADSTIQRVRVHVAFKNGECELETHVWLVGSGGVRAESTVNDRCMVDFTNIPVGTYHLIASGRNFSDVDSGGIALDSRRSTYEMKVTRDRDPVQPTGVAMTLVSALDLGTPVRAQKEFAKANALLAKQDLTHAVEGFQRAITLYPDYAGAYNSLGVIYSRLGQNAQAAEALQKAININGHFALAYMNLGLLNLSTGDFSGAATVLNKASSFGAPNTTMLMALSYAEFMNHRLDEAILAGQRAHGLPGEHSLVHQVAARAYEQKRDLASAIQELELFLKEEPSGSQADIARKELAAVQASSY